MAQTLSILGEVVVVSNRLPVRRVRRGAAMEWETSPGGLVSALRPVLSQVACTWIGWSGVAGETIEPFDHDGMRIRPLALKSAEIRGFYDGMANRTLWPLFHDAIRPPRFEREWWDVYTAVNQRFADAAAQNAGDGAAVWIHDYHLQLVPGLLREQRPDLRIGFFLHIPFPPQELFAQLPWRREIIHGMAGADVVGFQTRIGARNFLQVAERFAGYRAAGDGLRVGDRRVRVGSFPVAVDTRRFELAARDPAVMRRAGVLRQRLGGARKIMLGVDRLDYTKGIDMRLRAFERLLRRNPAAADECVFVQIAVPSREQVAEYRELREVVEHLVGEINGEFGELGRVPVHYLHRSVGFQELVALYLAAEIMLVTPLRDGMNLVAKEFVATRVNERGVLVLSEFTGAAKELDSALVVNPHDVEGTATALAQALAMPASEQARRMRVLRNVVSTHDVFHWAQTFFGALEAMHPGRVIAGG